MIQVVEELPFIEAAGPVVRQNHIQGPVLVEDESGLLHNLIENPVGLEELVQDGVLVEVIDFLRPVGLAQGEVLDNLHFDPAPEDIVPDFPLDGPNAGFGHDGVEGHIEAHDPVIAVLRNLLDLCVPENRGKAVSGRYIFEDVRKRLRHALSPLFINPTP